ncbi:unnamed protein product [Mytilus coruscus]|uniref:ZMYM2-like/QRICH1 C-terminal domain-containing protein n=1 Tax=Mytilus coruscus TaxID=42192 RepID=A0A6J8DXN8_MYTCO|nr:unnamed protein product [Mytilus coruscus]
MSFNENLQRGQKVRLFGGRMGVIKGETDNFGFPLLEIKLEGGKLITEARYMFDIISEPDRRVTHTLEHDSPPPIPGELLYQFETDLKEVYIKRHMKILKICQRSKNQATARKNVSDMRTLTQLQEKNEIHEIPPEELNSLLCQYLFSVRKTDGEEYEPSTLRDDMGNVKLCKDSKSQEVLQMNKSNTKTRTGANLKNTREILAWDNATDPSKCPVEAFKLYKSKIPTKYSKPEDPFYCQENTNPDKSILWFKAQRVGINKLGKFMKKMALNTGNKIL